MTYDARRAAYKEQDVWVKACIDSLCHAYEDGPSGEMCAHQWCHGIVDVLSRAYVSEHMSYRMPNERDPPHTREGDQKDHDLYGYSL